MYVVCGVGSFVQEEYVGTYLVGIYLLPLKEERKSGGREREVKLNWDESIRGMSWTKKMHKTRPTGTSAILRSSSRILSSIHVCVDLTHLFCMLRIFRLQVG